MNIKIFTSIALLVGSLSAMAQDTPDITTKYPGYRLDFQDEFDTGTVPDETRWNFETGMRRNHEDQVYTKNNATISNGLLVIEARKEKVLNPDYVRYSSDWNKKNKYGEYSSASIILKDPYKYHYGVYEVRAKIPVGTGYWPAIWGCGNKYEWPYNGELDIMEYYGNAIHANLAWGSNTRWNATWASKAPKMNEFEPDFGEKFHIWRTEWDHNSLRIYLDDRLINETNLDRTVNPNPKESWYNVDNYNPYRDPNNLFGVWLNLALGGDNGGSLTNTVFPAQYLVDYVRVYVPESEDAPLKLRLSKAQALLDGTTEGDKAMEYPTAVRKALSDAIAEAESHLGSEDVEQIDSALDALQEAMNTYEQSMVVPANVGEKFSLIHTLSGCALSTGWFEEKECVLLLNAGEPNYNQEFKLINTPEGAKAEGFNLVTGDGKYVYRDSWNLFVTSDATKLGERDFIFNLEIAEGKIVVKNAGSSKYFGVDNSAAWSHVYSDKNGRGTRSSYFEYRNPAGVDNIAAGGTTIDAVYNLQGIKIAGSLDELGENHRGQLIIVTQNGKARKVVR